MKIWIPIRFKILLTALFVITSAVGIITFTMAKLFHIDKTAYIHDLTSVIAQNVAEESHSLLSGYSEKLLVFTRVMYEEDMRKDLKSKLLQQLFKDFREFVAVTLTEDGKEPVIIYDAALLESVGITKKDIVKFRIEHPLPIESIKTDEIYAENSTLTGKLPTLSLTVAYPYEKNKKSLVTATVRLDNILKIAGRSEVFETFIVDGKGNMLAHSDMKHITKHTESDWLPHMEGLGKEKGPVKTMEYVENGVPMVGGFVHVGLGDLIAAVQIEKSAAYLTARELLRALIGVSLVLLVVSAILSIFWSRRLTRPLERLSEASKVVGQGDFNINVERSSNDEIGALAGSFNLMVNELHTRSEALEEAQEALVHSEKMAAFGQIGAGIAHEVKNPLAGILGYAQLTKRKLDKDDPLMKNLETIEKETKRCKAIIDNLMKFARQEKMEKRPTNINHVINDAIAIVDHQLTINNVILEKELDSHLPDIMASANQIQQVLMNLMINAQQAMAGERGTINISTQLLENGFVEVSIRDTGPGMTEEVRDKIFEPFFTTKTVGQGTGLGLSVSYGILRDHDAQVIVNSAPGEGANFILRFPLAKLEDSADVIDKGERKTV